MGLMMISIDEELIPYAVYIIDDGDWINDVFIDGCLGLFESAIAQSGSALCPWAILNYVGNYTKQLGVHMNCPTSSSVQLVQCLRTKNATDFIQFQKDLQVSSTTATSLNGWSHRRYVYRMAQQLWFVFLDPSFFQSSVFQLHYSLKEKIVDII